MAALPRRLLGRTGLDVTTLGFGAMELRGELGGWGKPITDAEAEAVLNAVLDAGINFVDTSPDYGRSEESIGRFLADRRDEYFLASKCGCVIGDTIPERSAGWPHRYDRENVVTRVNHSLETMRTDHLDLLQVHMSPSRATLVAEDTIGTLLDLKSEGKIRFIGISSIAPNIAEHIEMGVFDVFQIPYSGLQRQLESAITAAAASGAGCIIRGGVAKGRPGEGRGVAETWKLLDRAAIDELTGGMDRMEFMLRFTLSHPHMSTAIVGSKNPDHIAQNAAAAAKGPLPDALYAAAKTKLEAAGSLPR